MPRGITKANLPQKICATCGKPFTWRKKWEKVWDQAAGSIVVEEAGGRVSDLDGNSLDFSRGRTLANNRGVLATNGPLHEAFLAGLKAIGA